MSMKRKSIRRGFLGILLCIGCIQINTITQRFSDLQANATQKEVILSPNALMDVSVLNEMQNEDAGVAPLSLNGHKLQDPTTMFNPVIFVEFSDDTGEWITQETLQKAENLYNDSASSVANYFHQISFGKLQVVSCFFPNEKTAQGYNLRSIKPFRSSYPRGYIQPKSASNPSGFDPAVGEDDTNPNSYRYHEAKVIEEIIGLDGSNVVKQLTQNITVAANYYGMTVNNRYSAKGFDWSFPQASIIKTLEQRSADSFTFVFRGSVTSPQENPILWPHKYAYPNSEANLYDPAIASLEKVNGTNAPVYVDNYVIVPGDIDTSDPNKMNLFNDIPNYGVVIHEFLHQFYAPELYRMNYQGQAVGKWDVLGEQTEEPQALLQYTNQKFGIWDTPDFKEITKTTSLQERSNVTLDVPTYEDDTKYTAVKIIPEDTSKKEYFMVEYRKKSESGIDSELPNSGLLVYRVREDMPSTNTQGAFCGITCGNMLTGMPGESTVDEVFVFRPNAANATLLDQHYIDPQLQNATFPRTINGLKIDKIGKSLTEVPASSSPSDFDPDTLYFSDGSNSGIRIENIADPIGNTMSFSVLYGEEGAVDVIKTIQATQTEITQRGTTIDPNTISIQGGAAPYAFTISSVKKDDVQLSSYPFTIDHANPSDSSATLQASTPLASGSYEIEITVHDANTSTISITLTYQILPGFPDASKLTYTNEDVKESNVQADTKVGEISIDGCTKGLDPSDDPDTICYAKYQYTYETYELEFLAGKDYRSYFYIDEFNGRYVGDISAKGSVPAGSYEGIAKINFIDLNDSGDEIILDTIQKNIIIEIKPDGGGSVTTPPTISEPSGAVLNTMVWLNGTQQVEITLNDTLGLASISVVTSDGAFIVDQQETANFEKTYTSTTLTDTLQLPVYKNGTYTITITNTNGDTATKSFTVSKLDNVAPTAQITMNQREATITGNDQEAGIDTISYTLTTSQADKDSLTYDMSYTQPFTIANSFAGRLCTRVRDLAGNSTTTCEQISAIHTGGDGIDPEFGQTIFTPATWTKDSVIMQVAMQDDIALSGLSVMTRNGELLVDGQKKNSHTYSLPANTTHTQPVEILKNGDYTLTVNDLAGNTASAEVHVSWIDQEAPSVQIQIAYDTARDVANITINAEDLPAGSSSHAGLDTIQYQYLAANATQNDLSETLWNSYTGSLQRANAGADQGSICARAMDTVGNISTVVCKPFHEADNTKPSIAGTIQGLVDVDNDITGWTKDASLALSIEVSDSDSGIKSITLKKDSTIIGVPYTHTSGAPLHTHIYHFSVSDNGTYTLYVEDMQGNRSQKTFSVQQFDREKPIIDHITITAKKALFLFPTGDSSVSITAHDLPDGKHSGIKEYRYAIGNLSPADQQNDSNWKRITVTDTIEVKGSEEGTLYLYAYDYAGNRSDLFEEKIQREASSQSVPYLQSLQASEGSLRPSFSKEVLSYRIEVPHATTYIRLQAEPEDSSMVVEGDVNTSVTLQEGKNTLQIQVTAGQVTKTYTIEVYRASRELDHDAALKTLSLSTGSLTPAFDPAIYSYTTQVPNETKSVKLTATANSTKTVVQKDANKELSLQEGENIFTIECIAEDGTIKEYTITITREKQADQSEHPSPAPEPSNKAENSYTLKDSTTAIQVIGSFDEHFALVSEPKQDIELQEAWNSYALMDAFDIYITKDGERYTVQEEVVVRIPRKADWTDTMELSIVYIDDEGNITPMPTIVTKEYLEFTTNHFSTYAVLAKQANGHSTGVETGDTTQVRDGMLLFSGSGTMLIISCMLIYKKKRKHKHI